MLRLSQMIKKKKYLRAYFPSSSNSWYSSVNLVQIVNAILTEVPSGFAETQRGRCSYWRHARSSTPPGFTLEPQAERRIHAQLKRIGAPTGWVFIWVFFLSLSSQIRGSLRPSRRPFDASGGCICCSFVHTRGPVALRARSILCAFLRLCCISVRLCGGGSLCAHQTPRRRTDPPPGAQSRPFARILSSREDENEKWYYWPMVTQTLFLYTYTRSRCLGYHVTMHNIFIWNALFVPKMEDVLSLLLGFLCFYLCGQPCTRWKRLILLAGLIPPFSLEKQESSKCN